MHLCVRIILLSALVAGGVGCQPYVTPERLDRGLVLVLTGIEGRGPLNENICRGLDEGGVDCAIELVDWTSPLPGAFLLTLWSEQRNREKADQIAKRILRYKVDHPGRPVTIVGQSGGGAVAVWTAEAMPNGVGIDGMVIIAAALGPDYDLQAALAHSRRGIVSYHSKRDWVILGIGTTVYGTMEGAHTSSAGRVGFNVPGGESKPAAYEKLYQVPWRGQMGSEGHIGGHLSSGSRKFIARYVAPLVKAPQWDAALVESTTGGPATGAPPPAATAPAGQ